MNAANGPMTPEDLAKTLFCAGFEALCPRINEWFDGDVKVGITVRVVGRWIALSCDEVVDLGIRLRSESYTDVILPLLHASQTHGYSTEQGALRSVPWSATYDPGAAW